MAYQMSRVRGADHFRLRITHPTTVETLCQWLGLERADLAAVNPDLTEDLLIEGRELVVPVLESGAEPETSDQPEAEQEDLDSAADDTLADDAEDSRESATPLTDALFGAIDVQVSLQGPIEAGEAEPQTEQPEPVHFSAGNDDDTAVNIPESLGEPVQEAPAEAPVQEEPPSHSPPAPQTVTWRPFPKSIV